MPEQSGKATDAPRNGLKKAAMLMLALKPEVASEILKHMDRDNVEELTRQITTVGEVELPTLNSVVEEFYSEALDSQLADPGGLGFAAKLVKATFPAEEAKRIISQLE